MSKVSRTLLLIVLALLGIALCFAACSVTPPEDNQATEESTESAEPTERPTREPMRDISGDTLLADSLVYASEVANEVQGFYSTGSRNQFTLKNMNSMFEVELCANNAKGITKFTDYYGKVYFENSMDLFIIDTSGVEWTDRNSSTMGRPNTFQLGYYYMEAHIFDMGVGMSDTGNAAGMNGEELLALAAKWDSNNSTVEETADGIKMTVTDPTDPYIVTGLSKEIPQDQVNALAITVAATGESGSATIYYFDSVTGSFSGSQLSSFTLKTDGQAHTYVVPLTNLNGNLRAIRFDAGDAAGGTYVISSVKAVKTVSTMDVHVDRTYHMFPDKIHQEFRIGATAKNDSIASAGFVWKLPENTVDALQIRDGSGLHSDLSFDSGSVEYVGFHIKDVGVVGIIIPAEDSGTNKVTVELKDGYYEVRQFIDGGITIKAKAFYTVANRLYNDSTSDFSAMDTAARLERYPLTGITVNKSNSGTKFKGYNYVTGLYYFTKRGMDFNESYYRNPNKYLYSDVTVQNDNENRNIYMLFEGSAGGLECAALLDENMQLVPMPIEVGKNFCGEYEEKIYDASDRAYGVSIFPLSLKSGNSVTFRELHLFQNWGLNPLKQISFIQFFVGYYHLSTGVTESNCIAPYFVYGKDGWTLPDFRGASGKMWSTQPQFTSIGIHKWLSYYTKESVKIQSEYTGSYIRSYGPTYADMDYNYISDDGSYKFTLRHVEFPQTDENRTYYTISVKFLKDLTIDSVRDDFTILMMNSRDTSFSRLSYLDKNSTEQTVAINAGGVSAGGYTLPKDKFYYSLYSSDGQGNDPMNYSMLLRDARITVGGKAWDGNFYLRYQQSGSLDNVFLSLDEGKLEFKKGDTIVLNVILLPHGGKGDEGVEHARYVYEDSILNPVKVTAQVGSVVEDAYLPAVKCADNAAEFTVTGSRNRNTAVISGFTVLAKPKIYVKAADGSWTEYVTSYEDYDGYQVALAADGTYTYSFVYSIDNYTDTLSFRIEVSK